jgi:hypothetical protein
MNITSVEIDKNIHTRLEIFTAVVAEKARGGNFLHFLRHGGNNFYFPPPQRKFLATTHEIKTLFWFVYVIFILNLESKYRNLNKIKLHT